MTDHVKIYAVKPRIQYTADGTLTTYEFPFAIFQTSDIDVYFGSNLQDATTYTVSEARHSDGGSVTFETAPVSGTIITIVRNLSIERTSDFQEGSALRAKVLNDELDYQIACQQQIAENLNRSMVLPPYATDLDVDLTLPTPSAGKAIVWNSDGTNLENSTVEVNALEATLKGYKTAAESAATTATTKAGIASDKADIATEKAGIAAAAAATISEIIASKANKDMDNLSASGKVAIVGLAIPDYSSAVDITTSKVAPNYGLCEFHGGCNSGQYYELSVNNHVVGRACGTQSSGATASIIFPVKKDDTISWSVPSGASSQFLNFYPFVGV